MNYLVARPGPARSHMLAAAACDLADTCASLAPPQASIEPRLYLLRRGRVEVLPIPRGAVEPDSGRAWVARGIVPTLIRAGRFDAVGLAFIDPQCVGLPSPLLLHVFHKELHEAWETVVGRGPHELATLGPWLPAAIDSLDRRAADEIMMALNPDRG